MRIAISISRSNFLILCCFFPENNCNLPAIETQLWQIRTKRRQSSLPTIIEEITATAIQPATAGPAKCKL